MGKYEDLPNEVLITIRVPAILREDFQKACSSKSINPSALIRNFIIDFISDNEKKTAK